MRLMTAGVRLSKREKEVTRLVLQGRSNKQIALALGIAVRTVEFHLKNVYGKLGVSSRAMGREGSGSGALFRVLAAAAVDQEHQDDHRAGFGGICAQVLGPIGRLIAGGKLRQIGVIDPGDKILGSLESGVSPSRRDVLLTRRRSDERRSEPSPGRVAGPGSSCSTLPSTSAGDETIGRPTVTRQCSSPLARSTA